MSESEEQEREVEDALLRGEGTIGRPRFGVRDQRAITTEPPPPAPDTEPMHEPFPAHVTFCECPLCREGA